MHRHGLAALVLSVVATAAAVVAIGVTSAGGTVAGRGATAAIGVVRVPAADQAAPHTSKSRHKPSVYVALGDSYSSGPLIVPQTDPKTCLRSANNYAGLLSRALHVTTFRDVTCSSATTADFTHSQKGAVSGTAPPQYRALSKNTTLVTVGIGGNDIGLVGLAESCINLAPAPVGQSCAAKYAAGGHDVYAEKIKKFAPTYGKVIRAIRARAPHAKILMVGYPSAIRAGGCYPEQPILAPDATYIQAKIDQLNSVMRAQARRNHATYIDIRTSSRGHDACALPGQRWLEGLVPLSDAFPLHPNVLEMRNTEKVIARTLHH